MLLSKEGFEISNTTPDPNMSCKGSRDTSFGIGLELVERVCHSQGGSLVINNIKINLQFASNSLTARNNDHCIRFRNPVTKWLPSR